MGYVQTFKQIEDSSSSGFIKVAGGLVGKQQPRVANQGSCERHPLLLSTGELPWAVFAAVFQIDLSKPIRCSI